MNMWRPIVMTLCLMLMGCASQPASPTAAAPSEVRTSEAGSDGTMVPREFRHACSNPGTRVNVRRVPVTVRHADCDLTGVTLRVRGRGGAVVPERGMGVGSSGGLSVTRNEAGDVTVAAEGEAGTVEGG